MVTIEKIYAKYGEACHVAHLLETEIGNIRAMNSVVIEKKKYENATRPEKQEMLSKRSYNKTLGALLKDIGDAIQKPDAVNTIFASALKERNRLIHDFYYEYCEEIKSQEGRESMMQELDHILKIIADALSVANEISTELFEMLQQSA